MFPWAYSIHIALFFLLPLVSSFFFSKRKTTFLFGLATSFFLFIFGHAVVQLHEERNQDDFFATYLGDEKNEIIGVLNSMPSPGETIRATLKVEAIKHEGKWKKASGSLAFNVKEDTLSQFLEYGDRLILSSWINPTKGATNPKAFNYGKFLHYQNIHHSTYANGKNWKLLEKDQGHSFFKISYGLRKKAISILKKHLHSPNEFAVGSALLLGYKDEITEDVQLAYSGTGAMHVLAVSGLHVGILFGIIQIFFSFFKTKDRKLKSVQLILSLAVIWGFAVLTGASPSVLRASTMFSFLVIGNFLERNNNIYNTLAASAFFLLLIDPYLLFHPGFQLSYLAVVGIVFFHGWIKKSWYVENKIGQYIWNLICVSLAAQITTLPISLMYFDQFPTYFILSGLVVIPAAGLVMYLGLLLLLMEMVIPAIASFIGIVLYWIIWTMNSMIFLLENLPFSLIEHIHYPLTDTLLSYFLVGLVMTWLVKDNKKILWGALITILLIFSIRSIRKITKKENHEIVFYHTKGQLIDYFHQGKRITFKSDDLSDKQERNAAKNYRTFSHTYSENPEEDFYYKNGSFLEVGDKRFYFLNEDYYDLLSSHRLKVDGLILQNNIFVNFEVLSTEFDFDFIIADGSNKRSKIEFFKKKCDNNDIPFHQTPYIINLK